MYYVKYGKKIKILIQLLIDIYKNQELFIKRLKIIVFDKKFLFILSNRE